jgi:hypothetical protein
MRKDDADVYASPYGPYSTSVCVECQQIPNVWKRIDVMVDKDYCERKAEKARAEVRRWEGQAAEYERKLADL